MNHVDNPFKSPAILSFCPGFLGLERGLERVIGKFRVMAYVEIEAFIIANMVAGMESGLLGAAPIWTNAKTFDAQPFHGRIHGIVGGYPCPGESLAGLREGHLYKGFIWPSIRKAIAAAKPIWCFFENVDDHLTGTYPIVSRSLRNMGYRVEAGIFSAEEVGAPHERQRLFILAVHDSYCNRYEPQYEIQTRRNGFESSSKKLGDTEIVHAQGCKLRQEQEQPWGTGNEELANACREGYERIKRREPFQNERTATRRPIAKRYPAGRGYRQFEWEEPRTIEPGLGCTIDGYNFREDLLRAYGNSVVEETAELAFRTLMKKFGLDLGQLSVGDF